MPSGAGSPTTRNSCLHHDNQTATVPVGAMPIVPTTVCWASLSLSTNLQQFHHPFSDQCRSVGALMLAFFIKLGVFVGIPEIEGFAGKLLL